MGRERRQHPRAESDWTARIQRRPRPFDAVIRNISHSGIFVCCDYKLPAGELVRIAIEVTERSPLVIDAQVVWSRVLSKVETGGLYGIGFRFVNLSDEDRLLIDLAVSEYFKTRGAEKKEEEPKK